MHDTIKPIRPDLCAFKYVLTDYIMKMPVSLQLDVFFPN